MLIIEGPDGAGKTTLVNLLVGELNWPVARKVVDSNTKANTDLMTWVEDNVRAGLVPTIFDRHRLISEPIYGPLLRGNMEPGFDDFRWLRWQQTKFRALEPLVIWCMPPLSKVVDNVTGDPNNTVVEAQIETIYWLYFNEASTWPMSLVWDYTKPADLSELVARVKGWARHEELYLGR
jgi:hypothetical protein